jgi:hypothetical protein
MSSSYGFYTLFDGSGWIVKNKKHTTSEGVTPIFFNI